MREGKVKDLRGAVSTLCDSTASYRRVASRSASYPAQMPTIATRETARLRVDVMCHWRKTTQRSVASHVKSIWREIGGVSECVMRRVGEVSNVHVAHRAASHVAVAAVVAVGGVVHVHCTGVSVVSVF